MQNTTHHKEVPDRLIENFLISGISQGTLITKFHEHKKKGFEMNPEILFSMYDSIHSCEDLCRYIFPNKITLQKKAMPPKFHTFLVRNLKSEQCFCHAFIFYQKLNQYQIKGDFDYDGALMMFKKQAHERKLEEIKKQEENKIWKERSDIGQRTLQVDNPVPDIPEKMRKRFLDRQKARDDDRQSALMTDMSMDFRRKESIFNERLERQENIYANKNINLKNLEIVNEYQIPDRFLQRKTVNKGDAPQSKQMQIQDEQAQFDILNQIKDEIQKSNSEFRGQSGLNNMVMPTNPTPAFNQSTNLRGTEMPSSHPSQNMSYMDADTSINHSQSHHLRQPTNISQTTEQKKIELDADLNTHWYAPVAFVIQTKTEFHDIYKQILGAMHDSLCQPNQYDDNIKNKFNDLKVRKNDKNKTAWDSKCMPDFKHVMAFSELIANIAYLRTIPAPVFNSEINLSFMGTLINIRENSFTELPHKNSKSVKILFDLFDFTSIIKCVKALVFDYSMVVFANNHSQSLLFQVIEGIKQLMFPFTFDFHQFLPANRNYKGNDGETMKDLFESMNELQPCIFAIETFEDPQDYTEYRNMPNTVVVDINAATVVVNEFDRTGNDEDAIMPEFPKETEFLYLLNICKNKMFGKYDEVNVDPNSLIVEDNEKVQYIRRLFFDQFKPFLIAAFWAIDTKKQNPKRLKDYWVEAEYMEKACEIDEDDPVYSRFAKRLCKSQAFADFVDGYLDDQIVNYDIVNSILCQTSDLKMRYKIKKSTFQKFEEEIKNSIENLPNNKQEELRRKIEVANQSQKDNPHYKFKEEVVYFNYMIPSFKQRMMLFEKVKYLVDVRKREKDRMITPGKSTPEEIKNHKSIKFLYNELTSLIRQTYQNIYLKEKEREQQVMAGADCSLQNFSVEENASSSKVDQEKLRNLQYSQVSFGTIAQKQPSNYKILETMDTIPETKKDLANDDSIAFDQSINLNDQSPNLNGLGMTKKQDDETDNILANTLKNKKKAPSDQILSISIMDELTSSPEDMQLLKAIQTLNDHLQKKRINLKFDQSSQQAIVWNGGDSFCQTFDQDVLLQSDQARESHKLNSKKLSNALMIDGQYQPSLEKLQSTQLVNNSSLEVSSNIFENPKLSKAKAPVEAEQQVSQQHLEFQVTMTDPKIAIAGNTSNFTGFGVMKEEDFSKENRDMSKDQVDYHKNKIYRETQTEIDNLHMIYGKKGLLNFLANIFIYFQQEDQEKINFYFTIRDSIVDFIDIKQKSNIKFVQKIQSLNQDQFQNLPQIEQQNTIQDKSMSEVSIVKEMSSSDPQPQLYQNQKMRVMSKKLLFENRQNRLNSVQVYTNNSNFIRKTSERISHLQGTEIETENAMQNESMIKTQNDLQIQLYHQEKQEMRNNLIESYQFDENQWFWIEHDQECNERSNTITNSNAIEQHNDSIFVQNENNKSIFHTISYQEILFFMKLANTFEDQKYLNQMILQLIMNFPLVWKRLDIPYQQISENNRLSFIKQDKQISYHSIQVLEYMFPLDKLNQTLDNMCRQQIENLNSILNSHSQKSSPMLKNSSRCTHIFQLINQEYDMKMPSDYCVNELLTFWIQNTEPVQIDVPYYKDLLKLLITKKWQNIKQQITHEEAYISQRTKLFGKTYKTLESDRDLMKKEYFETIDERIFLECSVQRVLFETKDQKEYLTKIYVNQPNQQFKIQKIYNPVNLSVKFLWNVAQFWLDEKNQELYKKMKANIKGEEQANRQKELTEKALIWIHQFEYFDLDFDYEFQSKENQKEFGDKMSLYEFAEKQKQCFYLNIYNALILMKLAEIATYKSSQLYNFSNHSSWVALEQNTSIKINKKSFSAFQIKHEVIKNIRNIQPNNFICDQEYIHPFIDLAFFLPKGGSLPLENVCFEDVTHLEEEFSRYVNKKLQDKISIHRDFSLILLPEILKPCIASHQSKNKAQGSSLNDISVNTSFGVSQAILNHHTFQLYKLHQTYDVLLFIRNGFSKIQGNKSEEQVEMDEIIKTLESQIDKLLQEQSKQQSTENEGQQMWSALIPEDHPKPKPQEKEYIIEYVAHSQIIDLKDKLKQGLFQRTRDRNSGFYKEFKKDSNKKGPNIKQTQ